VICEHRARLVVPQLSNRRKAGAAIFITPSRKIAYFFFMFIGLLFS
jgi:hypothetical protein